MREERTNRKTTSIARKIHVGNADHRAFAIELLCNALAEALRRAGHDRDFARETAARCGTLMNVFLCDLLPPSHIYHWNQPLFQMYSMATIIAHFGRFCENLNGFYAIFLPINTPMTLAIISPRVQPHESPRQCRP